MTEATITTIVVAFFAALVPTVGSYLAYKTATATKVAVEANDVKTDAISKKADEIHAVSNSHLSKVTNDLELANQKIESLNTLVASIAGKNAPAPAPPAKE